MNKSRRAITNDPGKWAKLMPPTVHRGPGRVLRMRANVCESVVEKYRRWKQRVYALDFATLAKMEAVSC